MIFDFLPLKQVFILIDVSNCLAFEKTAVHCNFQGVIITPLVGLI